MHGALLLVRFQQRVLSERILVNFGQIFPVLSVESISVLSGALADNAGPYQTWRGHVQDVWVVKNNASMGYKFHMTLVIKATVGGLKAVARP
jgi:hypothetical protein